MTIYLHPNSSTSLTDAYTSAFKNASEIFVLSAFLRDWRNFDITDDCENATLVVGKDFGITRKKALTDALDWKQKHGDICHFYVADQIDGFHPKIVMWKEKNKYYLIIASSNLTIAAFESNYEANISIEIDEKRYQEISAWVANILAQCDTYQPAACCVAVVVTAAFCCMAVTQATLHCNLAISAT